ncbi:MAG: pantothenate kinase [Coleofasciculus sp. B1-GNL1-01]|uniref:pantothenate kinase n=1 Tax=Coleofasciculus sp. B1-GNL1-01 TaxID=3068484 RepID=UPI0033040C65
MNLPDHYVALMIGNSRLHWAWFAGDTLQEAWDTQHFPAAEVESIIQHWTSGLLPTTIFGEPFVCEYSSNPYLPLYIASVIPEQTLLWQTYPVAHVITLEDVPLLGVYPTLGIDRALAVLGAGETYNYPVLVIDAGTALTVTGVDDRRHLVGGAILPGLKLQLESLAHNTAALPSISLKRQLPNRWAIDTLTAIESGVIYTLLAGIREFIADWLHRFPSSLIAFTGGDADLLLYYIHSRYPRFYPYLVADRHLIFWGIKFVAITQNISG